MILLLQEHVELKQSVHVVFAKARGVAALRLDDRETVPGCASVRPCALHGKMHLEVFL